MTAIKLNSIEGLMVEKSNGILLTSGSDYIKRGRNECIDEQGNREITMDREKLAQTIYFIRIESPNVNPQRWNEIGGEYKEQYLKFSDAIISNQSQIIKAVV